MALTAAQQAVVKADIDASGDLNIYPIGSDGNDKIAKLYNLVASPDFIVWRTNVPTSDIKKAVNWTEYIARSAGERGAFELIISNGIVNTSDTNIQQGFADIFSGPQGATTRTALIALSKRRATRIEKLLATGTGSDASPATMTHEGAVSYQDIEAARNS